MIEPGIDIERIGPRLVANQKVFALNNIMRIREMMRYGTPGFRRVFQTTPYLLQTNMESMPGYIHGQDHIRGIYGFERSGFSRLIKELFPKLKPADIGGIRPCIQSLMLIGSAGSVGHTSASDLDYWVLVDKKELPEEAIETLQKKTDQISKWAELRHQTEVHFYLLDVADVLNNRLGDLDEDSSGDVMPLLQKEEFYRTMLHVIGRMPLWWTTPPDTTEEQYHKIVANLDRIRLLYLAPGDFIDLGFVRRPGPREYIGAAMWQTHKAIRDPFKAVLKILLILEQVENNLQASLLCDQVKNAVLMARPDQLPIDPYLMTIRRVLKFTKKRLPKYLDLIRLSAWFKICAPYDNRRSPLSDAKTTILEGLIRDWGWHKTRIFDLEDYPTWPEHRKIALGEEIKAMILDIYSMIASKLRQEYSDQVRVEEESLTRLNAQILARFTSSTNKVDYLPSSIHRDSLPDALNIYFEDGQWHVLDALRYGSDPIYTASRAARVASWLVHNGIWRPGMAMHFRAGKQKMKLRSLVGLLPVLQEAFPPMNIASLRNQSLIPHPLGPKVLVFNMEEPPDQSNVVSAEIIHRTSLGEMYHEVIPFPLGLKEQRIREERLYRGITDSDGIWPKELLIYVPTGQMEETVRTKVEALLNKVKETADSNGRSRNLSDSKAQLDID